ncbi:MAG TPA: hypothetical protein VJL29_00525, partial [Thermoguttaceae bacterium]|nr:hypothetical protein [Thermoguttaceae bacterium]
GGAIGTKYLALAFGVAVATGWLWMLWRRPERRRSLVLGMAIVGAVAAGTGGLWYARAAWHRGNPVYPFFCDVQGSGVMGAAAKETFSESRLPLGRGPVGLVAAPWYATMRPERLGDRGHQLGVLFLAALPGLLVARRLRGLGTLLIIAVVYVVLWYELRQYVRFLFPIVAPLSVAVVWAWMEMRRFPPRALQCAVAVQAVVLVAYALVPLHRGEGAWAVAAGIESRRDYLDRHEPTYGMATLANVLVKPGEQILSEDSRLFYFDPSITQEKVFRRACHYERRVKRPEDLSGELRAAGFTHLLLVENTGELGEMFDSTLARLAEADPSVERLAQCIARDADGGERRYRLVKLGGAARR